MSIRPVLAGGPRPWLDGRPVALATVVSTFGSSPSMPGTAMVVSRDGEVWGSVSGGCVEGDVHARSLEVLADGHPQLVVYEVSDDEAIGAGLACGGTVEIFVDRVSRATHPELVAFADLAAARTPATLATVVAHPDPSSVGRHLLVDATSARGSLGSTRPTAQLTARVVDDARALLSQDRTPPLTYDADGQPGTGGVRILFSTIMSSPRMLVFGSNDVARALTEQGRLLGFRVTICDARSTFATEARFPAADEVVVDWPHRYLQDQAEKGLVDSRTVVCVLTHDPKFDVPAIACALRLTGSRRPQFVGAMGSREAHRRRIERLVEHGLGTDELARLSSPIGLDLGGRSPEETAVSIAGEIVAVRWRGTGLPLSSTSDPLHGDRGPAPAAGPR